MGKSYSAGFKQYRDTCWMPEYTSCGTDPLACFKITPQDGVPREEVAAAVAAESSTGTWTTLWTDLLTELDHYTGRACAIEDVPGDDTCFYAFVACPIACVLTCNVSPARLSVACDRCSCTWLWCVRLPS